MAIKTIEILNMLIFQRQWRVKNGDCKTSVSGEETVLSDAFFHHFSKASSEMPEKLKDIFEDTNHKENEIYSHSAYKLEDLVENHIIMADSKLLDEVYDQ